MLQLDYKYIKNRRIELGITQKVAAEKMGMNQASTYLKYETGVYELKAKHLPDLAKLLNCKISHFFIKNVSEIEINQKQII